jgi:hypothetical protein
MNINNLPKPKCEEFVEGFRMTLFKTSGETKVKTGKLKRIGPDRGGYWEVVE